MARVPPGDLYLVDLHILAGKRLAVHESHKSCAAIWDGVIIRSKQAGKNLSMTKILDKVLNMSRVRPDVPFLYSTVNLLVC